MGSLFQVLISALKAKIIPIWTKIKLWTNISFIRTKIFTKIRVLFSELFNIKPKNEKDYYSFFSWLISKKLVISILVILGLLSTFYIAFINPPSIFTSEKGVKTYDYDSIPLRFVEGDVRILGESGYLAYEGTVSKGEVVGKGTLYRKDGSVVYKGEFDNNKFNGNGESYYPSGQIEYKGEFVDNLYNGTGSLYKENGVIDYTGDFNDGQKDGVGEIYDGSGNVVYVGNFSKNEIIYSDFLGKTTSDASAMYKGKRIAYSTDTDFVVHMKDINAMYYGKSDSNNVSDTVSVESVYVMKDTFAYAGKSYSTIAELKDIFGYVIYEGNTYVNMAEATVIHTLNQNGKKYFSTINGDWELTFDDAGIVKDYDRDYMLYMYTFEQDGIRYNFYCKDRAGRFGMYSMELVE